MRRGYCKNIEQSHQNCIPRPAAVSPCPELVPQTAHPPPKLPSRCLKPLAPGPQPLTPALRAYHSSHKRIRQPLRNPPAPRRTTSTCRPPQKFHTNFAQNFVQNIPGFHSKSPNLSSSLVRASTRPSNPSSPVAPAPSESRWTKVLRSSPRPSASSADKKDVLPGPSWKKVLRSSPRPSASSADKKGVLLGP